MSINNFICITTEEQAKGILVPVPPRRRSHITMKIRHNEWERKEIREATKGYKSKLSTLCSVKIYIQINSLFFLSIFSETAMSIHEKK